jgi:hypothetical protein
MRVQITIPEETADRARAMAAQEHRDLRRQIEKIVIDAMKKAANKEGPPVSTAVVGADNTK